MAPSEAKVRLMGNKGGVETGNGQAPAKALPPFGPRGGLRRLVGRDEQRRPGDCDIILPQSVYRQIVEHLGSDTGRELGGLLLGYEVFAPGSVRSAVVIVAALPAPHTEGTATRLTFPEETWSEFDKKTGELEGHGLVLRRVGWYHSHPALSIFLSHWDLDVCEQFRRPTHLALVVDPVGDTGGFFVRGREGFRQDSPQGFYELCDLQSDSMVTWKNMEEVEEAGPERDGAVPAVAPGRAVPLSFLAAVAALFLLAVVLPSLVTWSAVSSARRENEAARAALEQRLSERDEAVRQQREVAEQAEKKAGAAEEAARRMEGERRAMQDQVKALERKNARVKELLEKVREELERR
jgi:proteasome lid subunit RPN8/RPN11